MRDKYRIIGPLYDLLGRIYSGKNIENCKAAMLNPEHLRPGMKVLFAGVGHGRDAIRAAQLGADVTVVDLSETMLRKFQETQAKEAPEVSIRRIHSDILKVDETGEYDMVVANFFLNVFDRQMMQQVLDHLVTLGKPGAAIVIGDFSYPTGNLFARAFKRIYWYIPVFAFWLLARNPLHNIYNYPEYMERSGLDVISRRHFKMLNMDCYWSILGRKPG